MKYFFNDKIKTLKAYLKNSLIYFIYYHVKINSKIVFVESRDGKDFAGNIFRIVEEISKNDYKKLHIYLWIDRKYRRKINMLCKNYNIKHLKLIFKEWKAVKIMEKAKYIISDSGVPWKYVKRDGQIVVNTWHGTPLKCMGKLEKTGQHIIGTTQHFFFSSDYIIFPNEFMKEVMLRDYMVENVISAKALMTGYPRNSVFFDINKRTILRNKFGFDNKQVFAFLPTHRGMQGAKNDLLISDTKELLIKLDQNLSDDQIFLVKLHIWTSSKIDFTNFKHIITFPEGYETYDVLTTTDCLITDYSSVFFDYANSRNKIIIYAHDEEEYVKQRGMYFSIHDLPFPIVTNVEKLLEEMNLPKNYDDKAFLEKFCPYDSIDATQLLCCHIFKEDKICKEVQLGNGKENVLIYGGSLAKNGITTALISLLSHLDLNKRNYYVSFRRQEINSEPSRISKFSEYVDYLPIMSAPHFTLNEQRVYRKYGISTVFDVKCPEIVHRMFRREWDRCYYNAKFSYILHFDGYVKDVQLMFMEAPFFKTIFVHNDMIREISVKHNQNPAVLREAYTHYDKIAVVTSDLIEPTIKVGAPFERIVVVNNFHDYEGIIERSKYPIEFQKDTECVTYHPGGIEGVLNSNGKKFITIGRFSPEKGHHRLLNAFDKFCNDYPKTQLIIIGGHGNLYNNTLKWAKSLKHWKNVTIIKSLANPMPILKRCDLFILSSLYEGLGLVIAEADILGIPCFSTNIVGPRKFMEQHFGMLVEDSERGILQGMYNFINGFITTLKIDYNKCNLESLSEFESLFTEEDNDCGNN